MIARIAGMLGASLLAALLFIAPAQAAIYVTTGTLNGQFYEQLLPDEFRSEKRALEISLTIDSGQLADVHLDQALRIDVDMRECFPGWPCVNYGDLLDPWAAVPLAQTPTGLAALAPRLEDSVCKNRTSPYMTCTEYYRRWLYLGGVTTNGPVNYTLRISAVPEPATWAIMITGFGLAGGALRVRRRRTEPAA